TASGGVTEDSVSPTLSTGGAITFQDLDLIDTHTASFVLKSTDATADLPGYPESGVLAPIGTFALTAGTVNPISHAVAESADTDDTATVGWSFTLPDNDPVLQSLAAGQSLTQVYSVTITDNNGAAVTQDVS